MVMNWNNAKEVYISKQRLIQTQNGLNEVLRSALIEAGENALNAGPFSVMDKELIPPSGDKHDFIRSPTYAWPNPDTPDGLPYIYKDGEVGPEVHSPNFDQDRLGKFSRAVKALSWAYFASNDERFAERAVYLIKTWFLDPATKMNPNLTFSKATPGMKPPYPSGVISTHAWVEMMQGMGVLAASPAWTDDISEPLTEWFRQYIKWLQTSDQGIEEDNFTNNRGVWYDAQLMSFARFVGDDELAQQILLEKTRKRLDKQVAADGSLPRELERRTSLGYSIMTLRAYAIIALMGSLVKADLWHYPSNDNPYLRKAIHYISPFLCNTESWPHEQIKEPRFNQAFITWAPAALAYQDESLRTALEVFSMDERTQSIDYALFS